MIPPDDPDALTQVELSLVDQFCREWDKFVAAKKHAEHETAPNLRAYLNQVELDRQIVVFPELLRDEVEAKLRLGEQPSIEDYEKTFPESEYGPLLREEFERTLSPNMANESDHSVPWDQLKVPGYKILGELGRGGMGVVYKARHIGLKRVVALKMIRAGRDTAPEHLKRFRTEAEALARFQHSNIVQVFEISAGDNPLYMALEFVEGGSLEAVLKRQQFGPRAAAKLVEELAHVLEYAHRLGVIHRDLKPANILRATDGEWKVTDFGLACILNDGGFGITKPGDIMGTPAFMAPEQATGRTSEVGIPTDVYGLGGILYQLLTGRSPNEGAATPEQIVNKEPKRPRTINPAVPRGLEEICLRCLHKDPKHRYPSARALAEDLARFRRKPFLVGLTVVILVLAVMAARYFVNGNSQAEPGSPLRQEDRRPARVDGKKDVLPPVVPFISATVTKWFPVDTVGAEPPVQAEAGLPVDGLECLRGELFGPDSDVRSPEMLRDLFEARKKANFDKHDISLVYVSNRFRPEKPLEKITWDPELKLRAVAYQVEEVPGARPIRVGNPCQDVPGPQPGISLKATREAVNLVRPRWLVLFVFPLDKKTQDRLGGGLKAVVN